MPILTLLIHGPNIYYNFSTNLTMSLLTTQQIVIVDNGQCNHFQGSTLCHWVKVEMLFFEITEIKQRHVHLTTANTCVPYKWHLALLLLLPSASALEDGYWLHIYLAENKTADVIFSLKNQFISLTYVRYLQILSF